MQIWLDDSEILLYLTYNEGKLVVTDMYLNKLVDE